MEVLLVGQADSIFFEHYTKTIKKFRPDINFDVFSIDAINGKYDLSSCEQIYINKWVCSRIKDIRVLRTILQPFITWFSLYRFLKLTKKKYDIIHFKWLIPGVILFPRILKRFTKKIIATFWGSEIESQKILYSKSLYIISLRNFLNKSDIVASIKEELNTKTKFINARYGSSIIDEIQKLSNSETKQLSKKKIGIPEEATTISIGYSGKTLHQHLLVIEELFKSKEFIRLKESFHFILPFSYGCTSEYSQVVENRLKLYTNKYTIIKPKKYSDFEIARLRNATDIMIQLSKSDALSASIIESFFTGSIIISGKWLPYKIFREANLHFYELDDINQELPELILKLSKNIETELELCRNNKTKWDYASWDSVAPNWINIYEKVLNEA